MLLNPVDRVGVVAKDDDLAFVSLIGVVNRLVWACSTIEANCSTSIVSLGSFLR